MPLAAYIGPPTRGVQAAAADLRTKQYYVVYTDTNGKIALQTTADSAGGGVLMNTPNSGEAAEVAPVGSGAYVPVVAGGTITAGDKVANNNAGKVIARPSTGAWIGTALTSGVAGETIQVELNGGDG
jgi:flagellar basal body P-ring protein FlgI